MTPKMLEAAMSGLERRISEDPGFTPEFAQQALEYFGFAQGKVEIPTAVRLWVLGLTPAQIISAIKQATVEIQGMTLPLNPNEDDTDALGFAVGRRDAAEKLEKAVIRWGFPRLGEEIESFSRIEGFMDLTHEIAKLNIRIEDVVAKITS